MTKKGKKGSSESGFKGVAMRPNNRFQAVLSFRIGNKSYTKTIGSFLDAKTAYKARCEYIKSLM